MSIALPGRLTLACASGELTRLQGLMAAQAGDVVVDASAVEELDSSCVAVLLQCRREVQARGHGFHLVQAPDKLKALMALYGVAELFGLSGR